MVGKGLRVLLLLGLYSLALAASGEQCDGQMGSSLLQARKASTRIKALSEDRQQLKVASGAAACQELNKSRVAYADKSLFLMQATFGPTRASIAEVDQAGGYEQWINMQQRLPVESHREYFRERANPIFMTGMEAVGERRKPCEKGSRWIDYTFTQKDVMRPITITNYKIHVDGKFRSDIQLGMLGSTWMGLGLRNYTGIVCWVSSGLGGDVHLAPNTRCRENKVAMPNPAIYVAHPATTVNLPLKVVLHGTYVLEESFPGCALDGAAAALPPGTPFIVKSGNAYYRHEDRLALLPNLATRPVRSPKTCVQPNFMNEQHCTLPKLQAPEVLGLALRIGERKGGREARGDWPG
mmetsp:Transcript_68120/g.211030  ORF Transcript_68120/g.211030 Transcript_68120/m.211030 type:complete len:352 (+) Transcript_68120:83-1138(+)